MKHLGKHTGIIAAMLVLLLPVSAYAVSIDKLKINGFFDLEYEKADEAPGDTQGSFDQYHFNVLLELPVSDKITVRHHTEYEHVPAIDGGSNGGSGEFKTEWSYVEYLLNNNWRFRGGFALTPFGLYNENHDATPTYLSTRTPWSIYKTTSVGASNALFPKFSTGLFALGNQQLGNTDLDYVLYIANGENGSGGSNEAQKDDNTNKAFGGRIMVNPNVDLGIGASFFSGVIGAGGAKQDHDAYTVSAEYQPGPIGLRAEYAAADVGTTTQEGWYAEASYSIGKMTPHLRFGQHDPDDSVDNDTWTELVVGIAYQLEPGVVLKLENRAFEGEAANASVSNDYNEWAAAVAVAF